MYKVILATIFSLALFFSNTASAQAQTVPETVGLIRQNCAGYSNCYTSLSAWEAAYGGINFGSCPAGDLVCANIKATAQIDGNWNTADTSNVVIDGWTTDANRHIKIYTTSAARHTGVWDTTKYRLEVNSGSAAHAIDILEDYTIIDGIQLRVIGQYNQNGIALRAGGIHVRSNIVRNSATGTTNSGIVLSNASSIGNYLYNNIVYDWVRGIYQSAAGASSPVYNNTIKDSGTGIYGHFSRRLVLKNNLVDGSTTPFADSFDASSNFNATNGASATGGANDRTSQTFTFIDAANDNFHLASSDTGARDFGVNLSADSFLALTTDIDGQTRSAPYDIGADEISGSSTPPPPGDTQAPTVSVFAPSSGVTVSGTSVIVSANASDNVGVVGVQFLLNGAGLGSEDTTAPYSITWNTAQSANGSHTLTARARDAAGNQTASAGVTVFVSNPATAPDTQAPSTPTNLTATPVSSSQVNLSWNASTDNVGVTGYRIYRNGAQVATATNTSYQNTNLAANTTYSFTVAAHDAAGNVSGQTQGVSSTTPSATTPPPSGGANYPLQIILPRAGGTSPDSGTPTLSPDHFTLWAYPGITYRMRAAVIGGVYPYAFSLSGQPSGMSVDARGVITWTNPQASDPSITLTVTDAAGTQVQSAWGVTVQADKFRFLDCDVAGPGSGTMADPWKNLNNIPWSLNGPTVGKILYFRDCSAAGFYNGLAPGFRNESDARQFRSDYASQQWIAFPGERPIFNVGYQPGSEPGVYMKFQGSPAAVVGFETIDGFNKHFETIPTVHYGVFWDNFMHRDAGLNGSNPAFIMTASGAGQMGSSHYLILQNNDFADYGHRLGGTGGSCVKIYAQYKLLIEDNICRDAVGVSDIEGFALKGGAMDRVTVRGNTVYNVPSHGIGGNMHTLANAEILFNRVYNASNEAFFANQDGVVTTPLYIYRNTFIGRTVVMNLSATAGPFHFSNNVIISPDASGVCVPNSRIYCWPNPTAYPSRIILNSNLEGTAAQGITDAQGNLQGTYLSYLGTHGYQLGSGGSVTPPPGETQAPTVTAFSVTPSSLTVGSAVTASYTASDAGGSGLARAELWRAPDVGGAPGAWAQIRSNQHSGNGPVSGALSDTPAAAGTYWYGLHIVDGAGNWSPEPTPPGPARVTVSAVQNPPPGDTQAPSTPANLTATPVSSSQVNLSWNASTDNVGVTGYRIYRNGAQVATATNTSYQNTNLAANTTYSFTVAAHDAAGNVSGQTQGVSATTPSATTPPPSGGVVAITAVGDVGIGVAASTNASIIRVEFYQGTNATPFSTVVSAPFVTLWDSRSVPNGSHLLRTRIHFAGGRVHDAQVSAVVSN